MNLYIADMHFGHGNIIRFDHRPFADSDEMDHVLIKLWNNRVQYDDTVYIIGDVCYRSGHGAEWYFGHHHDSVAVTDKDIMLYFSIKRVL